MCHIVECDDFLLSPFLFLHHSINQLVSRFYGAASKWLRLSTGGFGADGLLPLPLLGVGVQLGLY